MFFITSHSVYAVSKVDVENSKLIKSIQSQWKEKRAKLYEPISIYKMQKMDKVFQKLLRDETGDAVQAGLSELNLMLLKTPEFLFISEKKSPFSGQGFFVINRHAVNMNLLQAPHAFHDRKTGNISIKLFVENKLKALAINTANRNSDSQAGNKISADMAHLQNSLFVAFSQAFVNEFSHGRIVQLHGFNANKRKATQGFDFILSQGANSYAQRLIHQKECLRHRLSEQSYVYPLDTRVLGGTKNRIGNLVRSLGFTGFEHIEISLPKREQLNRSSKARNQFSRCVLL